MKLRPVTYQLDVSGLREKLKLTDGRKMDEIRKNGIVEQENGLFGICCAEVEQAAKTVGYDFSGVDKPRMKTMYGLDTQSL
jgi:hypothetical protein